MVLHNMMNAARDTIFACDTEVSEIDLKTQGVLVDTVLTYTYTHAYIHAYIHTSLGPVGNGKVICISVYAGEEFDFGFGKGHALWVENIDKATHLHTCIHTYSYNCTSGSAYLH